MEIEGYVSLWVGNFSSKEELNNYLYISYDEDGDAIPSKFEEDFEIDYYDTDFREAGFFEKEITSIQEILKGCSYEENIIPAIISTIGETLQKPVNSMILLYNFKYNGQPSKRPMTFLGTLHYK